MKIAVAQMNIVWNDKKANYIKAASFAKIASKEGADLIAFPEMFTTGFTTDIHFAAESFDGQTPSLMCSIARKHKLMVIGGYVQSQKNGRPLNVSLSVDKNGTSLATYAKIHLISLLNEDKSCSAGYLPVTFKLEKIRAASLICYDLRFPELFRLLADQCGLIFVIASWPSVRQAHWDILLPARAVENQLFIVGVNRVGNGGGHNFTGGSTVIDPAGRVIASGGSHESLFFADIDLSMVQKIRREMPFLKDRKKHIFQKLNDDSLKKSSF